MLKLILGTDWIANREEVLRRIALDVKTKKENVILLVPELISHDTERRLCAAAGDTASRYAEVLSFTRLLRRVSEQEQKKMPECLDNGGRLVAMASAVQLMSSRLKSYADLETKPEFLSGLVEAVDEFKRCRISSADLQQAAGESSGTLAQKLEELSLILEGYDSVCAQGKQDPRDQMEWLLDELECCDFAKNHTFYIDGFPDLTRQNMAILAHLIRNSLEVTVSLNCDRAGSDRAAFEKAGETASELKKLANEANIPVQTLRISARQDGLEQLREKLFQGQITQNPELRPKLCLMRSDSVFDEAMAAAERIMELVRHGARYRDIGVVTADPQRYRGVLGLVFRRCGIPAYQSGTDDILTKNVVSVVLTAMEAAMEGLEQKAVLRYLKSCMSPLKWDMQYRMENYAVLWGIRGEKWNREWAFHPDGLGGEWTDRAREKLAKLNEARKMAIDPLVRMRDGLQNARDLGQQVAAVYGFMEDLGLAEKLEKLAMVSDLRGDNRAAQEYNQLWEIMISAMEQLSSVLGHSKWKPEHFSRLFRLLLSQYDVGTIPPVLDSVTVGAVDVMRCQQVKHLLVLGAEEGSLPSYAGSSGVLTDQERNELRRLGVPLTGGGMEGVASEFAEIYGCFCGATETVYVSCPAGQTAFLYRRLCAMLGLKDGEPVAELLGPALSDPWEAGAYLARWRAAKAADGLAVMPGYVDANRKANHELGTVERENVRALYGDKLTLSASQIDRQAECRLSYFLRYGLRAQERKEASVDPAEFGTFVHAVLEDSAKEIMSLGGFHVVDLDQTMDIAHKYADAYAKERFSELDSERLTYLFQRNTLELDAVVKELWEELSEAEFEPMAFELHFGDGGEMSAIHIPGQQMDAVLQGFVDRVDRFRDGNNNYFRVVDYKTGKKDFDYCDVYNGVGLQMLLYLFALEQEGAGVLGTQRVSAGVQYFPARFPYLTEDGKLSEEEAAKERSVQTRRRGLILSDDRVIQAMDPGEELTRLSCRRKKDGTITGDVADSAQFYKLRNYLFRLLGRLVDDIAEGFVEPNPYTRGSSHSACAWCPYTSVCAKSREAGRRNYKTMTAQRFWDEIDKEAERRGR